ncbi:hypothetical protein OV079_51440 [Nannocystis pusilla]|uniref:Uncharacterized protein n=1 Tax=Nannocystis pusilla TaxID=889268 RepID=A0A9X3F9D9_9BACT|nr:hypothetical protein [Nannocystis pusilla]MCY1013806.1 hypothetical protein [Nannocystis pusilla]
MAARSAAGSAWRWSGSVAVARATSASTPRLASSGALQRGGGPAAARWPASNSWSITPIA